MRACSTEGVEKKEEEQEKVSGCSPLLTHTASPQAFAPLSSWGDFGKSKNNSMLEVLFSSHKSLNLLQCCHGTDVPWESIMPSSLGAVCAARAFEGCNSKVLSSSPLPGFQKNPNPPVKSHYLKWGEAAVKFPQTSNYRLHRLWGGAAPNSKPGPYKMLQNLPWKSFEARKESAHKAEKLWYKLTEKPVIETSPSSFLPTWRLN